MKSLVNQETFENLCQQINKWVYSISERTLTIVSIIVLHSVFIPQIFAYHKGMTDKLPNFDAYILVIIALVLLNLRAIIKKDSVVCGVHMFGFVVNLSLIALTFLK